ESHWISTTNNQFAEANVISVHFDYYRSDAPGINNPGIRLGINNPIFNTSSVGNTLQITDNQIAGEPIVENNNHYHLQWVYNNSTEIVTYMDGHATLIPDAYDI